MLGTDEIGQLALGEVDEPTSSSTVYSASAIFTWTLSATAEFVWDDDGSSFIWG